MQLHPGYLLKARYRIERELGRGGMGAVYLAEDTAVHRMVAVKSNLNPGESSTRQFEREARLLAGLRHRNLPLVSDHFILDNVQYLVMDYIPGEDLSHLYVIEGVQPYEKVLAWGKQIGAALTYLHNQSPPVIHRDIKPSNLKLTPNGEIVLVDFGIAKASESHFETTAGARGFSPGFAPPEQYGSSATGPYSDQYALAATLYALLTGENPKESVDRMVGAASLSPPTELNPELPPHVDHVLMRAMAIEPVKRYGSVDEFINALADPSYVALTKPGLTLAEEIEKRKKQRKTIQIVSAVGIVLLAAWLLLGNLGKNDEPPSANTVGGIIAATQEAAAVLPAAASATATPAPPTATETALPTATATETPLPSATPTNPPPTPVGGGGRIAFVSDREGGVFQLFTMLPDGSDVTQLTFDAGDKSQPAWSPDGSQLLYVAPGEAGNGLDIWRINADGSDPVNLTNFRGDDIEPDWSPNGEWIAFTATRVADTKQLFIMKTDGSEQTFVTLGFAVEYHPFWSPDGNILMYVTTVNGRDPTLYYRTYDGKDPKPYDVQFRTGIVADPEWSSDGVYIAFSQYSRVGRQIAFMLYADRGATIFILDDSQHGTQPTWSPNNEWLVYVKTVDNNAELYITNLIGNIQTNLTNHPATDKDPAWFKSAVPDDF